MATTVSDYLVQRLYSWGIRRIYGYPGDGINGIMGALERAEDKIEFIQVRHEESASFMACAHAKFTGEVGVCMATSGPGAIHLLNGLYDAKMDHASVVAIVGQQARTAIGGSYQQEVDLLSLFKDVASEYVQMASEPSQIRHLVDRAMRIAKSERTVTCIIIPNDIQELSAKEPAHQHATIHSGIGYAEPKIIASENELKKAANILNEGEKVAILIGAGAKNAPNEVIKVAEVLGAGVAKALLGKAALPDDLPYCTGAIGLLGTKPSWDLMKECDTLFMIGSGFPYPEFLPEEGDAKGVQIDIDARMLNIRYPMEVSLQGDSKETLQALLPLLRRKEDRSWQQHIIDEVEKWWKVLEARAMNSANPVNPQRVFWELSPRLPEACIITADSGTVANWFARDLKIRPGMMASLSGNLATMCPGVPYAIAAKFAFPDRMPIALVGDGAMQMQGINELITIAKYWKNWSDPKLMILVLNNHDLNMVTWEQRVLAGDPKFEASQNVPDFPYAEYARMLGLEGFRIDDPADIVPMLEDALQVRKPVVVEVIADPNVPPLPPHITLKQAKMFTQSMIKGDPDLWGVIRQTYKDALEALLPH